MSENSNHPIFMGHIFWAISPYPKGSKQPAPAGGQTCRPRRISLNPRQNVGETSSAKNNDLQSTIHYNSIIDTKCFWCFTRSSGAETKPNKSCTQLEVGDALKCITSNNEIKHILREPVGTEKGDQLQKLDTFTLYIYNGNPLLILIGQIPIDDDLKNKNLLLVVEFQYIGGYMICLSLGFICQQVCSLQSLATYVTKSCTGKLRGPQLPNWPLAIPILLGELGRTREIWPGLAMETSETSRHFQPSHPPFPAMLPSTRPPPAAEITSSVPKGPPATE